MWKRAELPWFTDQWEVALRFFLGNPSVGKLPLTKLSSSKPSRNGRVVKCAVLRHGRSWVRARVQAIGSSRGSDLDATNACGYVWRLQVRGSKWLGCHAGRQEVGRCRTRGESEEWRTGKKACKRDHPGFETQGRRHQKSETGVSVAPQKGHVSSKHLKKKYYPLQSQVERLCLKYNAVK